MGVVFKVFSSSNKGWLISVLTTVSSQARILSQIPFSALDTEELGSELELHAAGRGLERHAGTPFSASVFSPRSPSGERK